MDSLVESSPPKICCNSLTDWLIFQSVLLLLSLMMSVVVQAAPLVFAATILTTSTLARGVYRLLGKHTAREYGLSPWRGLTCVQKVWTESILWQRKIQ